MKNSNRYNFFQIWISAKISDRVFIVRYDHQTTKVWKRLKYIILLTHFIWGCVLNTLFFSRSLTYKWKRNFFNFVDNIPIIKEALHILYVVTTDVKAHHIRRFIYWILSISSEIYPKCSVIPSFLFQLSARKVVNAS